MPCIVRVAVGYSMWRLAPGLFITEESRKIMHLIHENDHARVYLNEQTYFVYGDLEPAAILITQDMREALQAAREYADEAVN